MPFFTSPFVAISWISISVRIKPFEFCFGVIESLRLGVEDWEQLCLDLWTPLPESYTLNDDWKAVIQISELPYQKKIWILQEITLSKSATFFIGSSIIALGLLLRFLYAMRDAYTLRKPVGHSLQANYPLKKTRECSISPRTNWHVLGLLRIGVCR
jgi:hypothetical protein